MRVAVLGAGAIGGTIAALLHRAGHQVEVTARGAHLDAIQRGGLQLSGAWGTHRADVLAGAALAIRPQMAIVTTKVMDAAAVVADNASLLTGVPLIVVQNGLGGVERVAQIAAGSTVVGGLSLIAASLAAPGSIVVTTAAETWVGAPLDPTAAAEPAQTLKDAVQSACDLLSTAVPCSVVENFDGARWTKLIINQVNAIPAITGMSVQEVIQHPELRAIMTSSMREAARVGLAGGIHFETINGVGHDTMEIVADVADGSFQSAVSLPMQLLAYLGDVPNPGSTLQSIRRGQSTEIDYLNGAVVDAAAGTGIDTKVNSRLVALVHDAERTGAFLSAEQVLAAIARP